MIFVFYFFAALLILLSAKSFLGGVGYLRFFKRELAKPRSEFTPFVTVIAPCRGLDDGLEKNLLALVDQDYPDYEVIFVVDDKADPAVEVISGVLNRRGAGTQRKDKNQPAETSLFPPLSASLRLSGKNPFTAKLIIVPKAQRSSQKVENLREAVLHAANISEAFVFVDSDVRPSSGWLGHLVAPLHDKNLGAATGYRWFISKTPSFASELRSAWNASIASALGPNTRSNFCWGGSMAIRRDTFERLEMREKWLGTLSDDFTVTRAVNEAGLPIVFVPQALTASVEDCSFGEMLEFTTRQMKITRVYAGRLWLMSFFGSGLFYAVMIAAYVIYVFSGYTGLPKSFAFMTLLLVSILSIGKAWLRLNAAKLVLTDYNSDLRKQFLTQNTFWLLSPAIFFYNSVAALVSRRLTWRGTVYELKSPTETVIIAD